MRLSHILARLVIFVIAIAACVGTAWQLVGIIEAKSRAEVGKKLMLEGIEWASVETDGLRVFLDGTAPNESERLRAGSVAASVVEASRVINQLLVQDTGPIEPPRFSIEILRSDTGISLIGLVPPATDRKKLIDDIRTATGAAKVTDLLETADYPFPKTWPAVVRYATDILKTLPHTKISADAGRVAVTAMAQSPEDKTRIELELARRVPDGVRLALDITAPRPVVSPFLLRFVIDPAGARFDACAADDEEAAARILAAARTAGAPDDSTCLLALGVPSPRWGDAAVLVIDALRELGGGTVTLSDADISLIAPKGTEQARYDDVVGRLETSLPGVFSLTAELPVLEDRTQAVPEFVVTLSPEGQVLIRGQVDSAATRDAVIALARARFRADGVHNSARLAQNLPENWALRVLTATEALTWLKNGAVILTPDDLTVRGDTGDKQGTERISGMLTRRLGESASFQIDVTYEKSLDPEANKPTPDQCETWLKDAQDTHKIAFEPGSAKVDTASRDVLDQIAEIFRRCGQMRMEIAGHTDSQGGEEMNQALSETRARAILAELRNRRVLTSTLTAKGYGEAEPIADNDTEEGREANRRIEFKLYRTEAITAPAAAPAESPPENSAAEDSAPAPDSGSTPAPAAADPPPETSESDNGQN